MLILPSGASAIVQVFVTPKASLAGTTITYKASNIIHTVTATIVVPKIVTSNVSLTQTANNLVPKVGQKFNYIVIATNNGPGNASRVHITDKIPAGLMFNSYKATQGTYNSVTGIWNVGTLTNGTTAVLQLFVTPKISLAGTVVTNTATSIGQIVATTVVVPKNIVSNVTVSITSSNLAPKVGQEFHYTITITNKGLDTVSAGSVKDILPNGLTFNSYTSTRPVYYESAAGIWDLGSLASGESQVLQLFVTPTASLAGTIVTNAATHTGQFVVATIFVPKITVTNVTLTQTASNLTPKVGQNFYYTITATNTGPDTATGVQVLDKSPAGLIYKTYHATQGTYNSITGIWDLGTLTNGATATLYILVTPTSFTAGKNVTNTAKLTESSEYNTTNYPSATSTVNVKSQKHAKKYSHSAVATP
ncbi:MAG: DUF11 domain-containing protein [Methanobacterium sp. ERen5]|nr:MAG: DUF11 domain-containing protein [Methanobacterium sp. ERen5]